MHFITFFRGYMDTGVVRFVSQLAIWTWVHSLFLIPLFSGFVLPFAHPLEVVWRPACILDIPSQGPVLVYPIHCMDIGWAGDTTTSAECRHFWPPSLILFPLPKSLAGRRGLFSEALNFFIAQGTWKLLLNTWRHLSAFSFIVPPPCNDSHYCCSSICFPLPPPTRWVRLDILPARLELPFTSPCQLKRRKWLILPLALVQVDLSPSFPATSSWDATGFDGWFSGYGRSFCFEFVQACLADCNVSFVCDYTLPESHILPEWFGCDKAGRIFHQLHFS